ncbi:MAG: hypothetical protein PHO14_07720, partial [Kiritimatiellae bacterium]|nr:hypothetical protein [Kiritimatiellia bacterium]
ETDPVFRASAAFGVTTGGIANWNTAFGWGDHALAGYLTTETDPVFTASDAFSITASAISQWDEAYSWGDHSSEGYLKQFDFSDFSAVSGIDSSSVSWWDEAYSWGDHSLAGYALQSDFSEYGSVTMIGSSDISNWDEAYNWGDHSLAGYLASESDPVWTAASTGYYQKTEADARYVEVAGDTMTGALAIDDAASGTLKLDSSLTNIAVGAAASAAGGTERIAIGHEVTNSVDNTARIRGAFYMDGGDSVWARSTFGTGSFEQLLPLPDIQNIVYVATNGSPVGPGTIDRPFDTPQLAYDYAAAHYTNVPATVVIAAGQYLPLNMNAGNIHVIGESRAQLDSLTISAVAHSILGKQRVENLVVTSRAIVMPDQGQDVKFHNCRLEGGLSIFGSNVEVQDCSASGMEGAAVTVGNGITSISGIALTQSSFWSASVGQGTLLVHQNVDELEVIGCKIFNWAPYAAIEDLQPATMGLMTPHLYSHNVIRGAETGTSPIPAVFDPNATPGPTMVFVHNAVWGDVGVTSNQQFYANNVVYGQINNTGGAVGWSQAGVGTGIDSAGNTEHQIVYPQPGGIGFPWAWQD